MFELILPQPIELLIVGVVGLCLFRKRMPEMIEQLGCWVELFKTRYRDPVQWQRHMARLQQLRELREQRTQERIKYDLKCFAFLLAVILLTRVLVGGN